MSIFPKYHGIVRSGAIVEITKAPEGEEELTVGTRVQVAGVDDAGGINVVLDEGRGEWRTFDPDGFRWREIESVFEG